MTTFTDFVPSSIKPFQFQLTLDGASYTLVVTWGLAGQRWYVNLYDQTGIIVFYLPLIGSSNAMAIESLTWSATTHLVTATTSRPHGLELGTVVTLTISNVFPSAYNGIINLMPIGSRVLTYYRATEPGGDATIQGTIGRDINLGAGYLKTSTLVFREATQQFEVSP